MILPEKLEVITQIMANKIDATIEVNNSETGLMLPAENMKRESQYQLIDSVAVIPIIGSLVHRGSAMDAQSGIVSYQQLTEQLYQAAYDEDVKGILLDIDSPGGEVDGCFTLVDEILKIKQIKPVWAIAQDMACSAAYAIASACDHIAMPDLAIAGSVGVVMAHTDISQMMEREGIKVTFIHAGKHKVLGNSYAPLSDEDRGTLLSAILKIHSKFIRVVSQNRNLSEEQVQAMEASTYIGTEALRLGLVDRISNPNEALQAFIAQVNGTKVSHMSKTKQIEHSSPEIKAEAETKTATDTTQDVSPEVADTPAIDVTTIKQEATAQAILQERTRIATILASDHAIGRETQAQHLAFKTDMSAETAIEMLAVSEKKSTPAPVNKLDQAMSKIDQPVVGVEDSDTPPATGNNLVHMMNQRKF